MRRERRYEKKKKSLIYFVGSFLAIFIIAITVFFVSYKKKLNNISNSLLSTEEIVGLTSNITNELQGNLTEASTIISKTIEETLNQETENLEIEDINNEEKIENTLIDNTNIETQETSEKVEEKKKELSFEYPVKGEITKEYSMDTLIFSETLQEWTVHQGIDIKTDRTTVVKSAEEGTVIAIKNDPRYGLTIIIEHTDEYKTVYSNLLSTEFVTEGEKVDKGQSIGTVGNSAAFEIADEPHLHFEILKDEQYLNPTLYLK